MKWTALGEHFPLLDGGELDAAGFWIALEGRAPYLDDKQEITICTFSLLPCACLPTNTHTHAPLTMDNQGLSLS